MKSKERYQVFTESTYIPIFSQPWWLDITCGSDNWDVYVVEKGGKPIAAMPYLIKDTKEGRIITRAPLTQNNGIIISYPPKQKYSSKLDYEDRIINEICDYIESLNLKRYDQQYNYRFENWLPFFWRYYSESLKYTYVIEDAHDLKIVEDQFSSDARNMLRKAKDKVKTVDSDDVALFYKLNRLTFERQGRETPFSQVLIEELFCASQERKCSRLLFAIDDSENVHSGAFLVWDEHSVYYLINGTDPNYKNSQANTLLIYEGIKQAHDLGKAFDFEGSVIPGVEKAFRQFGGVRKPYFRIYKEFY
ncbi:MAG: GNAT family N-acetyltransferase [Clostridia bacterium]|nr:GNAT family N-acetyltransferase [Clostridia bacterium]